MTIATVVLLLLHVPPGVASVMAILAPAHTAVGPVIGAGGGFTVTVVVITQPGMARVYVIVAVPVLIPVITPVERSISAILVLLLVHVPPVMASLRVIELSKHTPGPPLIEGGKGLMVTVVVALHPAVLR